MAVDVPAKMWQKTLSPLSLTTQAQRRPVMARRKHTDTMKKKIVKKKQEGRSLQRVVRRPPCVLFSVKEANETDVAVMKKLCAAGYEIAVVQEQHFEKALKCIERVRRRPLNRRGQQRAAENPKP